MHLLLNFIILPFSKIVQQSFSYSNIKNQVFRIASKNLVFYKALCYDRTKTHLIHAAFVQTLARIRIIIPTDSIAFALPFFNARLYIYLHYECLNYPRSRLLHR